MMGLSSMGSGGGGNPSTSNLSASAPPFTVDRLNPKPTSDPLLQYCDSPYVVEPFSHPSQYAHFSAPRIEPPIVSNDIINVPVSDGYRFPASASASLSSTQWSAHHSAYGGDVKPPYYNPYVPPLAEVENLLAEDKLSHYNVSLASGSGVTTQHDYTRSLFDLEYGPRWADGLGLDDVKRAKKSEFDVNFSSEKHYDGGSQGYENQPYQGGCGSENKNKFKEDSDVLYKNFNQVSDQKVYTGSSSTGYMEDKPCFEQHYGCFHYDSSKTLDCSPYPESYPSVISSAVQKDFPNYQNSCIPYEKCDRPVNTPFPGRASVTRSSPTVVIRPPPATNWNLGKVAPSHKPAGIHIVNSDYTNPLNPNDSGLKPNSKPKDESFETSIFKFPKQGNAPDSSISVMELSSPLQSKDTFDCKSKTTFKCQTPDVNGSSEFTLTGSNIEVVNSTVESSELIDHHSTAVDSPCWRGAPSSQFSIFNSEVGNTNHAKIDTNEQNGFGHGELKSLLSTIDSSRVFSEQECNMGNENECGKTCEMLGLGKTLDAVCSTTEQISLVGTTERAWIPPLTRSKGVELSGGSNMMATELSFLNNLTNIFDMKVSDTKHLFMEDGSGVTVNDVSGSAAVAVRAAEKVLASPSSQEDGTEKTTVPVPRLDVPAIVNTIHSLSKLLQFHISSDACSLGEDNAEILKHVIRSLNSCLSKKGIKVQAANNLEPKDPVGETSRILEEYSNMGVMSGDLHTKCEASNSCTEPDYLHFQKGERNCILSGKKDEISPIISPLRDDLHIAGDDDMTKAIKKVLEENLHINEDMHSQALLFKSLWLESEAKLCSISYKARFERMKIQMEEMKLKTSKANEDIAEMTSKHCMSPDLITMSELAPKAHSGTFSQPTSPNNSTSGMSRHADGIEASVLARFNILKCREENPKPIDTEKPRQSEMVTGKHGDTIMARFNILKSREENTNRIKVNEEKSLHVDNDEFAGDTYFRPCIRGQSENEALDEVQQPDFQCAAGSPSGGKHGDTIMARINILKSREENTKLIKVDEEKSPHADNDEFADETYFRPRIRGQSENEALDKAQQPDFQCAAGSPSGGNFKSYFERAGYESPIEYGISVTNDPPIHLARSSSRTINENNLGRHDSSSSEWEHVLKEDLSWKN